MSDYSQAGMVTDRRGAAAGLMLGALAAGVAATQAGAQAAADPDVPLQQYALNLNYLVAQYICYGLYGGAINPASTRGVGVGAPSAGAVTGARRVQPASDVLVARLLPKILQHTESHINFLRGTLFASIVAQPPIDLSPAVFTPLMRAAGVVGANETFDAFASENTLMLGAFLFLDMQAAVMPALALRSTDDTIRTTFIKMASVKASAAGALRVLLMRNGVATPSLIDAADRISDQRDRLDGATDLDQGLSPVIVNGERVTRIVPGNADARVLSRSPEQTLNILYGTTASVNRGGFFPEGLTGTIRTSAS